MARKASPWWRSAAGEWYVTIQGVQTRLGVKDKSDEAAAFAAFHALLAASTRVDAGRPEPIASLTADYLDSRAHRISEKTHRDYAFHLRWLTAAFGNRAAGEIDPDALEKRAAGEKWSDSHRANVLWTCQSFLRWCGRKDLTLHRPAKESRGGDSLITPEVYARVLRETTGDLHQLCRVLWLTGARPMEVAGLTVEMIDWPNGTATLKQHKNRRKGKRRVIYFPAEALIVLREQTSRYGAGSLFRGQLGEPFTRRALVDRFHRVSAKIGHRVRAYDFRHSFVTRSLMAGTPAAMVASLVGNSVAMIERFYSHVGINAAPLREAAERAAG